MCRNLPLHITKGGFPLKEKDGKSGKPEYVRYRIGNLAILTGAIIFFSVLLFLTGSLGATSSRMPRVVGIAGLILCAFELYREIRNLKSKEADEEEHFEKVEGKPAWVVLLSMVAYMPALYIFGFLIATTLYLFIMPLILGRKKILSNAIFALAGGVGMWACFVKIFSLRLPSGWLIEMFF